MLLRASSLSRRSLLFVTVMAAAGRPAAASLAARSAAMSLEPDAAAGTGREPRNVLGGPLESCCTSPITGFFRDGFCRTIDADHGRHVVCAIVTREFLDFTRSRGNDLSSPRLPGFPGLVPGDKWCLCAMRWKEALEAGVAPPVVLAATHAAAVQYVTLEQLSAHAAEGVTNSTARTDRALR